MSDIEILNQIKDLADKLASSRNRQYVNEAVGAILSGDLDRWDKEEFESDLHECE